MRLPARFRLSAFPNDDRLWKVDWFGDLFPNQNAKSEPLLELHIVPFKNENINQETLKQKGSYDYNLTRQIKVGISLLPFLHLGTFWNRGIHQTTSLTERVFLKDLQIDLNHTRILSAKNFEDYKILTSYFPSIKRCPETTFFEIAFPKDTARKILIPSYEVIRFYYAGSSNLTRRIITGGIRNKHNQLFNPKYTSLDENTGIGQLILRDKLVGTDRHNVARMAFSRFAEAAAWSIYSSIVRNFNNNERRIVEARFPFIGKTDLQVCGKWFRQDEIWHFLVYFIEFCSHPLPFNKLIWGFEKDKEEDANPSKPKEDSWITRTENINQDEREIGHDSEPSLSEIFEQAFYDGEKFTDLKNKEKEERIRIESTESGDPYNVKSEKINEKSELSTGEGTFGSAETQRIKIRIGENNDTNTQNEDKSKTLPAGWELFTGILAELERDSSIITRILTFDFDNSDETVNQNQGIYFPRFVSGKRIGWGFLDKQQTQRRQVMLAEVKNKDKYFYLFDIEVNQENINDRYSMLIVKDENYGILDKKFWKQILIDCARNRGIKRELWFWNNTHQQKIRHDLTEITKYAFKICEFLV